ncbi:protein BatD [Endozoicomonas sp. G2_1]|uniref:BatD family protein n=1 Tax=Endozoicomonas sp. G2_1 TaxID=2821091 RepID=UPI001ADA01D6|nr:BatD family protein [Endozoicomonas sp. G2_1]MBO9488971.1 protein BatD [Endozoicomonas sp. G2_1]
MLFSASKPMQRLVNALAVFKKILYTFSLLLVTALSSVAQAEITVTASVDKNPVMLNESLIFTVIANGDVDRNALDTSPLLKNFTVGRTSVSSQTSMVNFKTSRTTQWTTVLIPKQLGKVVIPSLQVADSRTNEIALTVVEASQSNQQRDIFIESSASATDVYVQQQFTLSVKLHFAAELQRGSLTEPELSSADIKQVGKDSESEKIINGRRYRVIERTFAIKPQQSGQFTLKPPMFSGEIIVPSRRNNGFFGFNETKPVSVLGEDIEIDVKPIPSNFNGQWLPSELLTLHHEWQPSPEKFVVGEPITRTVTLTAAGVSEEQLPDIELDLPNGLKVYPDQAESHTGINKGRLVSQKVYNFAIVASKPGQYQLPAVRIPWWNTVTNKYQEAILPARTITVAVNPDFANTEQAQVTEQPNKAEAQTAKNNEVSQGLTNPLPTSAQQTQWLQWLFLALWLLTCLAWFISSKRNKANKISELPVSDDSSNGIYLKLLAAAKQNDGQLVLSLLPQWVNAQSWLTQGKRVSHLSQTLQILGDDDVSAAIDELQASYFNKSDTPWRGDKLTTLLQKANTMLSERKKVRQSSERIQLNP